MASPKAKLPKLSAEDYSRVYEPSDDTFLLCDALEQDRALLQLQGPLVALEIGSGSGCVITFLALLLRAGNVHTHCMATDINPDAAHMTQATAQDNGVLVDVVQTSLVDGLLERLTGKVDVLLFNPPYVPTPDDEVGKSGIEASWAGGEDGRVVIDKFLPLLPQLLSAQGKCYLVLVEDNKPKQIARFLATEYQLKAEIVIKRQACNEALQIMHIQRF
jgi:release factor glutamine methyltransferase